MNTKTALLLLLASMTFAGSALAEDEKEHKQVDLKLLPPASTRTGLTYETDIKPLLQDSCFRCHGEEKQRGGIRLDSLAAVLKGGEDGPIVTTGDGTHSLLVISVARIDRESAMPPQRKSRPQAPKPPAAPAPQPPAAAKGLTPEEVGIVRAWVDQGAK